MLRYRSRRCVIVSVLAIGCGLLLLLVPIIRCSSKLRYDAGIVERVLSSNLDRVETAVVHERRGEHNTSDETRAPRGHERERLQRRLFPDEEADPVRRAIAQTLLLPEHVAEARKHRHHQQSPSGEGTVPVRPLLVLFMSGFDVPFMPKLKPGNVNLVEAGCPVR